MTMTISDLRERAQAIASITDQIEELQGQCSDLLDDAKSKGYDPAMLKKAVKLARDARARKKHDQQQSDLETYLLELDGTV